MIRNDATTSLRERIAFAGAKLLTTGGLAAEFRFDLEGATKLADLAVRSAFPAITEDDVLRAACILSARTSGCIGCTEASAYGDRHSGLGCQRGEWHRRIKMVLRELGLYDLIDL